MVLNVCSPSPEGFCLLRPTSPFLRTSSLCYQCCLSSWQERGPKHTHTFTHSHRHNPPPRRLALGGSSECTLCLLHSVTVTSAVTRQPQARSGRKTRTAVWSWKGDEGRRAGGRRVRGRSSIPGRCTCARAVEPTHTRTDTRARARAHTPKKSSVTCSLSKPALAPGKTYPFLVSTPTSGSSSLRRHPYNIPNYVQKEKCTLGTIYIYMYLYLSLPLLFALSAVTPALPCP